MLNLKTMASWPWVKLKASSAQVVTEWLFDVHMQKRLYEKQVGKIRAAMLWGFSSTYILFAKDCMRFDDSQVAELIEYRAAALNGFVFLTKLACDQNRMRYKVTPSSMLWIMFFAMPSVAAGIQAVTGAPLTKTCAAQLIACIVLRTC